MLRAEYSSLLTLRAETLVCTDYIITSDGVYVNPERCVPLLGFLSKNFVYNPSSRCYMDGALPAACVRGVVEAYYPLLRLVEEKMFLLIVSVGNNRPEELRRNVAWGRPAFPSFHFEIVYPPLSGKTSPML